LIHPGTARDLLGYVAFASYSAELPLLHRLQNCSLQRDTERHTQREGERESIEPAVSTTSSDLELY
jgi:hypothetical protein